MIYPSMDTLLKKTENRFALCIITGKRARQLISGAHSLNNYSSKNAVTIAINEVSENKIPYVSPKHRIK
ncbi:MAG: DNA-directed RNA polymerase subunit omega [Dethiobacter sp.]|jgi:DNA-directed RNA polymerase subunit omega|nr:DNA-directed RNA polymerase subunit omega [Dethiobacter sp.]MBS4022668.1 DNA-directed RNA polymerase subunit omega [Dethiobacter sp.]